PGHRRRRTDPDEGARSRPGEPADDGLRNEAVELKESYVASYTRKEAREWARERMFGVANVTIPTMTGDFKRLNEKAIRHDVELAIEHGFVGSLSCSEVAITMDQYIQF